MNRQVTLIIGLTVVVAVLGYAGLVYAADQPTAAPKMSPEKKAEKKAEKGGIEATVTGKNEPCSACKTEAGKGHNVLKVSSAKDGSGNEIADMAGKMLHYAANEEGKKLAAGQANESVCVMGMVNSDEGKISVSKIETGKAAEEKPAASAPAAAPAPAAASPAPAGVGKKEEKKE
ncbi:MAG: hypothetical protein HY706_17480 [Candidatus Hydrogenedentes bacterium]|nr:hypothetical protein [Candidatus Hydrogenedentota bacterium]